MQAEYPDVRFDGPPRAYGVTQYPKRYVAIHNTANDATDAEEADYSQVRTDGTSTHYCVDNNSITQTLRTEYGANHGGSSTANRYAISYEITGTNGKSRTWWLANVAWPLLARQIARDCRKWSIPAVLLTVSQMQDGKTRGIVTHDLMRRAWGGTTHTDPGPNFPLDHLLALVRAELDGDDVSFLTEKDPETGRTWAQLLRDPWYALFKNSGEGRPAGSLAGELDAAAAADEADAARDATQLSRLDLLAADLAVVKAQRVPTADEIAAAIIRQSPTVVVHLGGNTPAAD